MRWSASGSSGARARPRKGQVGSGDRSQRIRTYNFPQGRVTDHRINLTLHKLDTVLEGTALDEFIDALIDRPPGEPTGGHGKCLTAPAARGLGATLGDGVRAVQQALAEAGVEDAGRDARLLVAAAAGVGTQEIIVRPERPLSAEQQSRLQAMLARRCAREPVSRILGEREFYGRRFVSRRRRSIPAPIPKR